MRQRSLQRVIFPRAGCLAVTAEVPPATESLRATKDLPFSATSGPEHAQQRGYMAAVYSITSSARRSSECGTAKPSVLAVFRLSAVSNRVGACTGSSLGAAPRRIALM